ncbi:MAG TPA: T9SS type A sorting domain-containing protein [Gammaproteobacteria bacterium]|nr:T9SS type A sorting domain-containing protein [Gammaproteobacteria bacterium]
MRKYLLLLLTVFLFSNIYSQNYQLEFETTDKRIALYPSTSNSESGIWINDRLDFEGDGIYELITFSEDFDTVSTNLLKVYDGYTHQLKWEYNTSAISNWRSNFVGFYDIDGDMVREAVFYVNDYKASVFGIRIIDPQSNSIEFSKDCGNYFIFDIDSDSKPELIIYRNSIQIWGSGATHINSENNELNKTFKLKQNYPNPFNPSTKIEYQVQKSAFIKLRIFNSLGQLVKVLVQEKKLSGEYSVIWDGKDKNGNLVPTGTYFYQLYVDDFVSSKKMILLK